MQIDTSKVFAHWKTTAAGVLVLLISASTSVHFDTAGHFAMTEKDWFTVGAGVLAAMVGLLSKDAGTTEAVLPGSNVSQAVPSHEVPDDPTAKPLVK